MYTTLPLVLILCTVLQVGSQFSWIKNKYEALLNFVMQGEKTSLHKNNLFGRTAKSNNAFSSSIKMLLKFSYCRCSGFDDISSPQAWGGGKIKVFFFFTVDEKLRLGPWGTNDEKSACNLTALKWPTDESWKKHNI